MLKQNMVKQDESNPSYVRLDQYSGPLDLLLQLIQKQKMNIFEIDIHKITFQYVEYLKKVPRPDLENAGDFYTNGRYFDVP